MATMESKRPRAEQVLDDIYSAYAMSLQYELLDSLPENLIATSSSKFANTKKTMIAPMLLVENWDSQRKEKDSFFSEWIVMLGLRKVLSQSNLNIELAPPHLENGFKGRTGVDLIASKKHPNKNANIPVLALNVKLKKPRLNQRAESYKYDAILGCPSIELSLGDFSIQTKKSGKVGLIPWIRNVAIPNVVDSGHIPDFQFWERYLLEKVSSTVFHYMIKVDDFIYSEYQPSKNEKNLLPDAGEEFNLFYDNLSLAYMTLKNICEENELKLI